MNENLYFDKYVIERSLGEGSFGKVKLAYNVDTKRKVALKIVQKINIKKKSHITRIRREVRIMRLLQHPHIINLEEIFEDDNEILLALEYVPGGELFNFISSEKVVKERMARRVFRQIVSAVDYCHQNCIIHRDIKPENILMDSYKNIKLADFGFVNVYDPNLTLDTYCGSPIYASPEMVGGIRYIGPEVDVWSLGIILYLMLSGTFPFDDEDNHNLCKTIISGKYEIPDFVSEAAKDLISKILVSNTKDRATLDEIKNHPWLNDGYCSIPNAFMPVRPELNADSDLDETVLEKMKKYGFKAMATKERITESRKNPAFTIYYLIKEGLDRKNAEENESKVQEEQAAAVAAAAVVPQHVNKQRKASIGIPDVLINRSKKKLPQLQMVSGANVNSTSSICHSIGSMNSPTGTQSSLHSAIVNGPVAPNRKRFSLINKLYTPSTDVGPVTTKRFSLSNAAPSSSSYCMDKYLNHGKMLSDSASSFRSPNSVYSITPSSVKSLHSGKDDIPWEIEESERSIHRRKQPKNSLRGGGSISSKKHSSSFNGGVPSDDLVQTFGRKPDKSPLKQVSGLDNTISDMQSSNLSEINPQDAPQCCPQETQTTRTYDVRSQKNLSFLEFVKKLFKHNARKINLSELLNERCMSSKSLEELTEQITCVLNNNNIDMNWFSKFKANCAAQKNSIEFKVEICHVINHEGKLMYGVVLKQRKGSPFTFHALCSTLSDQFKI